MKKPNRYSQEIREQAVRMVLVVRGKGIKTTVSDKKQSGHRIG